jgi:hypothetical protein
VKKSNIASQQQLGLSISAQVPVKKFLQLNIYGNIANNVYKGVINNSYVKLASTFAVANVSADFTFKKGWKASIDGFYRGKGLDGVFNIGAMGQMNAGVSKSIMKKKGTLKLSLKDPLGLRSKTLGSAVYSYVDTEFKEYRDNRQVSVNFTYRFGKGAAAPQKRKTGGADEEKGRVKSGS